MFAGLDPDEINEFDAQTLQAALLAANADFGPAGFTANIAGGDTAFDQLADAVD